jgi:predicted acetyltransferase
MLMAIEVRFLKEGELPRFREVLSTAFGGGDVEPDWDVTWEKVFESDRIFVATEGDELVGGGGSFSFTMTVPGAELPTAGLTIVGVLPTHRRRGILTSLMRFQLEDARAHGEPMSILWASEEVIYQRFGYGLASEAMRVQVEGAHGVFRNDPGPSGKLRLLNEEEALKTFPDVYEQVRRVTPGMVARHQDWWKYHRLFDPKSGREGSSPYYKLLWEDAGEARGYAIYRVREGWDELTGLPENKVTVNEVVSCDPDAHRELWRYLFAMDLSESVTAYFMAPDDPLPQMVLKPRHLKRRLSDATWLRIIDIKAALEGRTYRADGSICILIADSFMEDNQGLWTIATSDGKADVSQGGTAPDLVMEIGDLGTAYLGGTSFNQLARAGRVVENTPGAVSRADAMFRSDRAPWSPEIF